MSSLSEISIKRPVLAIVFSILIVLLGIAGYSKLGVREYPSIDLPVITVQTSYPGANANIIESQITEPLEEAINEVDGIKTLSSISSDGRSNITIEFDSGIDLSEAANNVRDKVSVAIRRLPPDVEPPVVIKADPDAGSILTITMQSDKRSLMDLTQVGERTLKERLQTIPGVSRVYIMGDKSYAMRIVLNPVKMQAIGITPQDVSQALSQQNIELPSGRIEGSLNEYTIRTLGQLSTPEDFEEVIVKKTPNGLIRLKDIATVRLSSDNERTMLRGNGVIPMIGIAVQPQPGANYIDIVDEAYRRVDLSRKDLPEDIVLNWSIDQTISIRKAIKEVRDTIFVAFVLVIIVIFFFLRNWRSTLIPIILIPISLIGSLAILYLAGYSINILSLLGLVLATGLVVDDAIVVMENIYVKIEQGMHPMKAAFEGSREVYFAVISTSITLICVFIPIFFIKGLTGELFKEFAMVVIGTIIISTFITLSLTPMMSSRLLKKSTRQNRLMNVFEQSVLWLGKQYNRSLAWFMDKRWLSYPLTLICMGIIFGVGSLLPGELAPMEDKSKLRYNVTAPEGTSFEAMDNFHLQVMHLLDTIPEKVYLLGITARAYGSSSAVNSSYASTTLVEPWERTRSQEEIAQEIQQQFNKMTFARCNVSQDPTISSGRRGGGNGLPIQYIIQAPDIERLKAILPEFIERVDQNPAFSTSSVDLKFTKPELELHINRKKALNMGVSVRDIAATIQTFLSEQRLGYFVKDGKQYFVLAEIEKEMRNDPNDIKYLSVKNDAGQMISLDNLVDINFISRPPALLRFNRYTSATISAGLAKDVALGDGIKEMNKIADELLDESFNTSLGGSASDYADSSENTLMIFFFALILVYLTLAAQFESFRDPFVIMFTIPLALAGAILALYFLGHTLNIFSQIGMIVLIGIVTKNAILIIEFANQKRSEGLSLKEAAYEAASQRFRPILMTALSTVLGSLPIALALGSSSTSRIPMGISIIGGLLFSLLLTLYIIPALYSYWADPSSTSINEEDYV